MKLGVKYCGGCGPKFDRVEQVDRMKRALSESWEFVSWNDAEAEHILIVAGCDTACVETSDFTGKPVHWLNSEQGAASTIETLKNIHAGKR